MLSKLYLTNFKSWPEASIQCGAITGLFGTNSSGKTSLIQFLLLLKQTKDATDRRIALDLNGDFVQLGTIHDTLFSHDEERSLGTAVSFKLNNEISLFDPSQQRSSTIARGDVLNLTTEIGVHQGAPSTRSIVYSLGDMEFRLAPRNGDSTHFDLSASSIGGSAPNFCFTRTKGRPWQLPAPIKSYAFPDQARTYFQNSGFLADLEAAYELEMDKIFYLGPLREFPKRDYLWSRSRPTDVGQRGERAVDAILAATENLETRNLKKKARRKPFQEMIAYWLRSMGLIEDFSVQEIAPGSNRWQVRVKTHKRGSEVLLTDVGFGVSQVLPVITLLQYVPEGATVILEQPEIHLHPLAQAELADVIIQAATHRKVQVFLESHSEHLLLRLQRRIAEEFIPSEDVRLYFCDAPEGRSKIVPLEMDVFGNIINWPEKFMGDAFQETAEAELARLHRLHAAQ